MSSNQPPSGGMPQGPGQQSNEVMCPNCKGGNPLGAAVCQWCGTSLQAGPLSRPTDNQPGVPMGGYAPPGPGPVQAAPGPQPTQYGPAQGYAPPPGAPQMGVTGVVRKRRTSPCFIIGGIALALILLCGAGVIGLGLFVVNATQPVASAGDAYMTALRDGDYSKAFNLSAPALQQEATNAQGLQSALSSKQPATWSFTSRNISNGTGTLSGTTTYKTGSNGTVDM
ncbi:MAG: zinc ribbon domain-containing protein, partial [Chloroflexota bacterium]|nr:zinc ribbon domain-containing protein [Chloroflexota bacterium]